MKKPIIIAVVLVLAVFAILVSTANPGSPLYGIKSFFGLASGEPEETVLGGHVSALENELRVVSEDTDLTSAEAVDAKGRIVNALIGINTEVNTARENESVNEATKQDLRRNLYRLNDSYADQRPAILKIDAVMGVDSATSPQSLLNLMAQTQLVFKRFVVELTGTGIILREAADNEAIDEAASKEVDDATGAVIIKAAEDQGGGNEGTAE